MQFMHRGIKAEGEEKPWVIVYRGDAESYPYPAEAIMLPAGFNTLVLADFVKSVLKGTWQVLNVTPDEIEIGHKSSLKRFILFPVVARKKVHPFYSHRITDALEVALEAVENRQCAAVAKNKSKKS
jgi:hypothetical protein